MSCPFLCAQILSALFAVTAAAPIVPLVASPYFLPPQAVLTYAAAPPVVETNVHYAETPVVVGHSAQVIKPILDVPFVAVAGAAPAVVEAAPSSTDDDKVVVEAEKKKFEEAKPVDEVKTASIVPLPIVSPFVYGAPAVLDLKAPIPSKEAPPMDELVKKTKVQAPVRVADTKVTPEITVQHPTKVNVEKVTVEVPVAQPYAHPVPVPVVPQLAVHHFSAGPAFIHV